MRLIEAALGAVAQRALRLPDLDFLYFTDPFTLCRRSTLNSILFGLPVVRLRVLSSSPSPSSFIAHHVRLRPSFCFQRSRHALGFRGSPSSPYSAGALQVAPVDLHSRFRSSWLRRTRADYARRGARSGQCPADHQRLPRDLGGVLSRPARDLRIRVVQGDVRAHRHGFGKSSRLGISSLSDP